MNNDTLFYALLKELTFVPAVWGFEEKMITYLENFAQEHWIAYTVFPEDWIVLWNLDAPTYATAHIDEVGAYITYCGDQWIHFDWVWWVSPSMFIWRDIEIYTEKWIVEWVIVSWPLITDVASYRDLTVLVDEDDKEKIQRWDQIRLKTVRRETAKSIFASVVDNRLWVAQLLHHMLERWLEKVQSWKLAYCFTTQEEVRNKWAIKLLMALENKPKMLIINDILPFGKTTTLPMDTWSILVKTQDYEINKTLIKDLPNQSNTLTVENDYMNRSEAMQLWNITWWDTIHFFSPIYNYHHGTYFFEKAHIETCTDQLSQLLSKFS